MKIILFCNLPYSFSILKPLEYEAINRQFKYVWFVPSKILNEFPYKDSNYTSKINDLIEFNSDAIFVPGNDVPHFLRGLKIQVFHGLAGEKKGHFRIRDYFDLYLTSGPYFTSKFKDLVLKHKNFDVLETGWCKLDNLYNIKNETIQEKVILLEKYKVKNIILYSPTFSPSLTSGIKLIKTIQELAKNDDILVIIKFHDKMNEDIINDYENITSKNLIISKEKDITKLLQISDLMISDTSSVVYEFILLNKPVITLNSISENINWENSKNENEIFEKSIEILNGGDCYELNRKNTIKQYHPYTDGKSSSRMFDSVIYYISVNDVPKKRNISLIRKFKIWKHYK